MARGSIFKASLSPEQLEVEQRLRTLALMLVGLAVIGICLFMRLVYIPTPPDARLSLSSENLMRLGGSPGRLLGNVV